MISWVSFYLGLTLAVAQKSKDTTKHGCIITDSQNDILGLGFNGYPKGFPDEEMPTHRPNESQELPSKYDVTIHAEVNAVNNCSTKIIDGIAYISGKCCPPCLMHLYQNGVRTVYMIDRTSVMLNDDTEKIFNFIVEKSKKSKYGELKIHIVKPQLDWLIKLGEDVSKLR